jgi:hypothetical protein
MIGPYDGRNPRKILLSKEEYISMKNNIHNENDE